MNCQKEFVRVDQPPVVEWTMQDGVFIKQMYIAKAGTLIPQHSHEYDHTSMLAVGSVRLVADGVHLGDFKAPKPIVIKKGVKHLFQSLEDDTIIYCVHNLHSAEAVAVMEEHELLDEVRAA